MGEIKTVAVVLFDGVQLLDVSGPVEVLTVANALAEKTLYQLEFVALTEQISVKTSSGLSLQCTPYSAYNEENIDVLVIPGAREPVIVQQLQDERALQSLKRLCERSEIKASVCMGAFFLAELGYLDERKVTTHWDGIQQLKCRYPALRVQDNILYVNDEDIWTSAGITSGIDMMLAFVMQDVSGELALMVARILVVYLFRQGGQAQFSMPINYQGLAGENSIIRFVGWLEDNLQKPLTAQKMAEAMFTSERNLNRKCQKAFAMSPARLLNQLRLDRARRLLEDNNLSVKKVALECGFEKPGSFSRSFNTSFGLSPSQYRQRFVASDKKITSSEAN